MTDRIFLYNKDLQILTGKSETACYNLIKKIRAKTGKTKDQPITIYDFSDIMRVRVEHVCEKLK